MRLRIRLPALIAASASILAHSPALACSCDGEMMSDAQLASIDLVAEVEVGDRTWMSRLCGKTRDYVERPMSVRRVRHGQAPGKSLWLRIDAQGSFFGRCEVQTSACDVEPQGPTMLLLERVEGNVYRPLGTCSHLAYWMRENPDLRSGC